MRFKKALSPLYLLLILLPLGFFVGTMSNEYRMASYPDELAFEPAPFEAGAIKVSLEQLERTLSEREFALYVPTWLPNGLKLVGIWAIGKDNEMGNLAVFLYSSEGRDKVATAEVAFEVSPMESIPFDPSNSKGTFITINGWEAYYDEHAPVFWEEYREIYGPDSLLVNVQIGLLNYNFRGEPSLTMDEMSRIIESMKMVSAN